MLAMGNGRAVRSRLLGSAFSEPLTRTLLMLTFVTGIVDAVCFLGLGQVFAAMQTGNVVFLGLGIADAPGAPVVAPLVALTAFIVAGLVAVSLGRLAIAQFPRGLVVATMTEATLLSIAAIAAALVTIEADESSAYALIALLGLAMGIRSSVARPLGGLNLATTVLNLTLTSVTPRSSWDLASGTALAERGVAFAAILAGAVTGALLLKTSLPLPIATAAALALAAGLAYAFGEPETTPPA